MLITCKCLNVFMDLGKIMPKGVSLSSLNLSPVEESHGFFLEGVAEVEHIVGLTKQIAALTVTENIGSWKIETCVSCMQAYYAKSKEDSQLPLISAGLIADPNTIAALKNHHNYSPVFRIVIKQPTGSRSLHLRKHAVQAALSGLQQQLGSVIKKEAEKTDDKIRIYTDQQYDLLSQFRNRAVHDHEVLVRLLNNSQIKEQLDETNVMSGSGHESNPTSPRKVVNPSALSTPKDHATSAPVQITELHPEHSNSLFSPQSLISASLDVEGVFNLEGMEGSPPENINSEGESDTDHDDSGSHDEGIDLRRQKGDHLNLAKSLPVNVPGFSSEALKVHPVDFQPDESEPIDPVPMDIAASIKALARSVHGDAVFGDLPRPRFSTQI